MTAHFCRTFAFAVALTVVSLALGNDEPHAKRPDDSISKQPTRTVLWISIDGIRPDYVDRGQTPTLDKFMAEGAYTRELVPVFPSLTFSSHVSIATGAPVRDHGVPGNSFIDISRVRPGRALRPFNYPPWADMLDCEPIWMTAARQGVRTASIDWPLSHAQKGDVTTEYFGERYQRALTDSDRIASLLTLWKDDEKREAGDDPLRLLLGYIEGPDGAGHQHGPDAPEPVAKLEESDALMGSVIDEAIKLWQRDWAGRDDAEFWILLSTDHGMSAVHTLVHIGHLAGLRDEEDVEVVTSGNVGHIFFTQNRPIEENAPERVQAILDEVAKHEFAKAYRHSELPEKWAYDHPTRTGDIVIVLDKGYTFNRRAEAVTASAKGHGGPLGMHGYDPATNPEMNGFMVVWRYDKPLGGIDLGRVDSLHLHATVAKLLGIEPAEKAEKEVVDFVVEGTERAFKGWELYCWRDSEAEDGWAYALLQGTNFVKQEEHIRRNPMRSMNELRAALEKLAKGESVFGMTRCPEEKRNTIQQMCAELELSIQ